MKEVPWSLKPAFYLSEPDKLETANKVNIDNAQGRELPATIVKDLPKITERFLSLKIHNDNFINWYTFINNIRYNEHYGVRITSCQCKKHKHRTLVVSYYKQTSSCTYTII
jgi:hypothetical protein